MLDVERFSSADDLMDHYAGVKARLMGGKPCMALPAPPKAIAPLVAVKEPVAIVKACIEPASKLLFGTMTADRFRQWSIEQGYHWFDVNPIAPGRRQRADEIIVVHAAKIGMTVNDLKDRRRSMLIAHARQDAMLEIHEEMSAGVSELGRIFNRDYSTIYHGIQAARERRRLRSLEQ